MATLTPRQQSELAVEVAQKVVALLDARGGQPALVDAQGLAEALQVSGATIDRWVAQGLVPVKVRVGGVRRFSVGEVVEALAAKGGKA